MRVSVINESGYEQAALGFSLSYNSTIERAKELLPKYAFGLSGENKFLESIFIWLDVTAPRFWWQEGDTYRVGSTKQSESTMHTLTKHKVLDCYGIAQEDLEYPIPIEQISSFNILLLNYQTSSDTEKKKKLFYQIKSSLPEGFLQRRIWTINYKCLQNIYNQRKNHKLPQWKYFCEEVLRQIEHPEFIMLG